MATIVGKVIPADGTYTEGHRILLEDADFDVAVDGTINVTVSGGGGGGGLGSVGLAVPVEFSLSNNPLTADGIITVAKVPQAANQVWASPDAAVGDPVFRALVGNDLPLATTTDRGAISPLSGVGTQFLNGLGAWATPPSAGGATIYSMSDDAAHSNWAPLSVNSLTPVNIPQLSNIPLAAGSIYEFELLLLVSGSSPSNGFQVAMITDLTDETYGMQLIENTVNASTAAVVSIDRNTGLHPATSALAPIVSMIRGQGLFNTVSANNVSFAVFCETLAGTLNVWSAILKVTQHRNNLPQM